MEDDKKMNARRQPSSSATLASSSQKLALYTDSCKTDSFSGSVHAGDAVYVEGLAPSTEPYAEKLVWQWTEDNETKSLTNALTVLSVRLFPDLDSDDDVDDSDVAGLASLSSEYGWLMPASTNVLRKLRLRTDVGLSGGAYTLTLSGDAGAFKVWADNSGTNAEPLLACGQTVTNGVNGVSFLSGDDSDLYVEALSNGTATVTYSYDGEGVASNITAAAWLKMTAFKVNLLEVGFSGSGEHILKKTGGDTWTNDTYTCEGDRVINDPVWKDMNLDGDVSEIDDTNDPVCFKVV